MTSKTPQGFVSSILFCIYETTCVYTTEVLAPHKAYAMDLSSPVLPAHQKSRDVTYPVVMTADGSRSTRLANKGFARHGVYGDFAVGSGEGNAWPE